MARITTKYRCGDRVTCKGIDGQVTAIFIRGRGRTYEFSYRNNDGEPACVNADECELSRDKPERMGYK